MSPTFGSPFAGTSVFTRDHEEKLRALNIHTSEHFVALLKVEDVTELLAKHLGISSEDLKELGEKQKNKLPKHLVATLEEPNDEDMGFGALEPPAEWSLDGPGPFESVTDPATLPASVNHICRLPSIRNQGGRATSVAFACTSINEDHRRLGGLANLSEQCLYLRCKENDGNPTAEGTYVRVGMDCLVKFGQSKESCEPYDADLPTNQPGPHKARCESESPLWRIPSSIQLKANSVNDLKAALAAGRTAAFSIPVYRSWYGSVAVRLTGGITMPLPGETHFAGQAMLLVGYQDDAATPGGGYFLVRNSWGVTNRGTKCDYSSGYKTLPYQYMTDLGWEAYTTNHPKPISFAG